jgi:hypothetical protein
MTSAEIEQVLDSLAATPQRLALVSQKLPEAHLSTTGDPKNWSAGDILAHLRACADVWGKSILAMIAQDQPTLRYLSPRTWLKKTDYLGQDFHRSLQAFTEQRTTLLQTLRTLDRADWSRGATFTATVKGREQTILSYAQRIAAHEHEHCEQLYVLLNQRQGTEQ